MSIVIDLPRTMAVLDRLIVRYRQGGAPYDHPKTVLPQNPMHLPKGLSDDPRRHAMYFFVLNYWMRGGTNSVDSTKKLTRLFIRHPDFFDAEVSAKFSDERLVLPFGEVGLNGLINSTRIFWPENARRLTEQYDGDPRNIFVGITTYEELLRRVKNDGAGGGFVGFGKKMTSMLAYYLMDQGLVSDQALPVPVDFHLMRIALSNELVKVVPHPETGNMRGEDNRLEDALRELYATYCEVRGVDPKELSSALWLLGAYACSKQPGNRAKQGLYEARATEITPIPFRNTPGERLLLRETCGRCAIESTCTGNFPSAYYYRRGHMVRSGDRVRPGDLTR